jgi:hypothetical protein
MTRNEKRRAVAVCAVMFVTGCASPPEQKAQQVRTPRDNDEIAAPEFTIHSQGPLDHELAMEGLRPPPAVAGMPWGTPLQEFDGLLSPLPVMGNTYGWDGVLLRHDCSSLWDCARKGDAAFVRRGDGTYTMAEYYNPLYVLDILSAATAPNGLVTPTIRIKLHTTLWMMCAAQDLTEDIASNLYFCGVRMFFNAETPEEIEKRRTDPRWVSRYEHVLVSLVRQFGAPIDYDQCFKVTITTPEEVITDKRQQERCGPLRTWSWCEQPRGDQIKPRCPITVTLAYDWRIAQGVVLITTQPVWTFARAQYDGGGDSTLYQMLYEKDLSPSERRVARTGRKYNCHQMLAGCFGQNAELTKQQVERFYKIPKRKATK